MELDGRVVIISGAARGQGAAHARRFVAEGARVALLDVLDEPGRALAAELGESAVFQHLDVTDGDAWTAAVVAIEASWGRVDALVNNAGIVVERMAIGAFDPAVFRRVLDINVTGTFLGMNAVAPAIGRTGGGAIVNISSIVGTCGTEHTSAYTTSKWAIRGLTRCAAVDLAPAGIRVNAVLPGVIDTDMIWGTGRSHEDVMGRNLPRLLVKRLGSPEDITEAVLFLISERAAYVTGAELLVDGGWTVR